MQGLLPYVINGISAGGQYALIAIGYTMVYAPGGNIHRTLYSGRNFEYYSEDPVLSGKFTAETVNYYHALTNVTLNADELE